MEDPTSHNRTEGDSLVQGDDSHKPLTELEASNYVQELDRYPRRVRESSEDFKRILGYFKSAQDSSARRLGIKASDAFENIETIAKCADEALDVFESRVRDFQHAALIRPEMCTERNFFGTRRLRTP
jgi:hypothetical protein